MLAVVGAGAMGTALAVLLHRAGRATEILATPFDGAFIDAYRRRVPHPGTGTPFPEVPLHEVDGWAAPLAEAEAVIIAVSTNGLTATVDRILGSIHADALWIVATKGWEGSTLRSAAAVVAARIGDEKRVVALVGPSLATEIAGGVPTAVVCASVERRSAERVAEMFDSPLFSAYVSDDVAGVEIGAALKNVIAVGIGMCDGLAPAFHSAELTNTKAFIFSRGLVEMAALAKAVGGRAETVLGLAGAGDLFVTALAGRNARFGALVGAGWTPEQALEQMRTTVEGYANGRAAVALADSYRLDLPVIRTIAHVLYDGLGPREAIVRLFEHGREDEM